MMQTISDVLQKPEIFSFCSCYQHDELFNVLDTILSTTITFIRQNFESIPTNDLISSLLGKTILLYQDQSSIISLKSQLHSLKSELNLFESRAQKLPIKSYKPSANQISKLSQTHYPKPCNDWRKGDSSIFKRNFSNSTTYVEKSKNSKRSATLDQLDMNIYPNWWLGLRETDLDSSTTRKRRKGSNIEWEKQAKTLKSVKTCKNFNDKAVEVKFESESESIEKVKEDNNIKAPNSAKSGSVDIAGILPASQSSSSNSAFFPSTEMKKFYQEEFKRLFGNALDVD